VSAARRGLVLLCQRSKGQRGGCPALLLSLCSMVLLVFSIRLLCPSVFGIAAHDVARVRLPLRGLTRNICASFVKSFIKNYRRQGRSSPGRGRALAGQEQSSEPINIVTQQHTGLQRQFGRPSQPALQIL
jgi:hypothetical protein